MDVARELSAITEQADTQRCRLPKHQSCSFLQYEGKAIGPSATSGNHSVLSASWLAEDTCRKSIFCYSHMNYRTRLTNQDYSLREDYTLHYSDWHRREGITSWGIFAMEMKTRRFFYGRKEQPINQFLLMIVWAVLLEKNCGVSIPDYTLSRKLGIHRKKKIKSKRIYRYDEYSYSEERSGNRGS